LSPRFFDGLREAYEANSDSVGLIAPLYDDVYPEQKGDYQGPASGFVGAPHEDSVNVVDGTAFLIPTDTIECVGILDEERFGMYGWGSDIDYAYRVREFGQKALVTHRAYINHFHQGSAKHVEPDWSGSAGMEMEAGMNDKYGPEWRHVVYGPGSVF
jgi:GT2 family glycosyltransferase